MSHCIDEVDRIYKSCGKTYELGDDGNYQATNPMTEDVAIAVKQICDCLG